MIDDRLIPAFYAACQAVADGQVSEVELEHTTNGLDGGETTLRITVRRDPWRPTIPTPDIEE
jgi:hypothetical protein